MKLAVSNIAWSAPLDTPAYSMLQELHMAAIEIAPTRIWPDWNGSSTPAATTFREHLQANGFSIPSLQAILFAKPECRLFGTDTEREAMALHLQHCADLAVGFGAESLVFGAPKNRDLNGTDPDRAFAIARDFFATTARYYAERGVCLCLEANPAEYASTFMTDSRQADRLVRAVASDGFRLHLDTACMFLAGEDLPASIRQSADILQHFHVSEPYLGTFASPQIDHDEVAAALQQSGYVHWISLEMREATSEPVAAVRHAVTYLQQTYGNAH